jgi:hypothetical protein
MLSKLTQISPSASQNLQKTKKKNFQWLDAIMSGAERFPKTPFFPLDRSTPSQEITCYEKPAVCGYVACCDIMLCDVYQIPRFDPKPMVNTDRSCLL